MSEKLIRIYKKLDAREIKTHSMIYGDLTASCSNCNKMNIKLEMSACPECKTEFKYIIFKSVKSHIPKMYKLMEERPEMTLVDYEDYKRNIGASKAEDFFK